VHLNITRENVVDCWTGFQELLLSVVAHRRAHDWYPRKQNNPNTKQAKREKRNSSSREENTTDTKVLRQPKLGKDRPPNTQERSSKVDRVLELVRSPLPNLLALAMHHPCLKFPHGHDMVENEPEGISKGIEIRIVVAVAGLLEDIKGAGGLVHRRDKPGELGAGREAALGDAEELQAKKNCGPLHVPSEYAISSRDRQGVFLSLELVSVVDHPSRLDGPNRNRPRHQLCLGQAKLLDVEREDLGK
jgi:hypothetical protein